jgi:hypothetical protein
MAECIIITKETIFFIFIVWGIIGSMLWYFHEFCPNKRYRDAINRIAPPSTFREMILVLFSAFGIIFGFIGLVLLILFDLPWDLIPCVRFV